MRVAYFWIPDSREVEMDREPKRVQTVLSHHTFDPITGVRHPPVDARDPKITPHLPACDCAGGRAPEHNVEVFYEDRIHDWCWKRGKFHYFSRAVTSNVWIRCEFDD